MTCEGCEEHVNNELSKVTGVLLYKTSYASRSSLVTFDKSKVDAKTIEEAINKTGYKVKNYDFMNASNSAVLNSTSCKKDTSGSNESGKSCCDKEDK